MTAQTYHIEGMDCADCALKIEKGVRQLPGVHSLEVNFALSQLTVSGDVAPETVRQRVEALGYRLQASTRPAPTPFGGGFIRFLWTRSETRLALAGGGLLLLGWLARLAGLPDWSATGLHIVALLVAGYPIARSGLANLWINKDFNVNLLMTLAAVGAIILGETGEAASLIFLFAVAEALEGYTGDRARRVLSELSELAPARAIRIGPDGEENVPVEALRLGDRLLVRPGDRIPMDGAVYAGSSQVNQAPITGESLPITKETGDEVFAGTVNGSGALQIEVTRLVQDNTIQRIIRMVAEAQSQRAPSQRMIDRFARVYTPAMIVIALLVALVPPLFFGQPLLNPAGGERGWLYRALTLLVIACPCALVISTPVTILSAITAAARHGVLIKGGAHLEALSGVNLFAFDKTGTLTRGVPVVTTHRAADCNNGHDGNCPQCNDVLALACALERRSSHPLAQAVVTAAEQRGLDTCYAPAEAVQVLAGQGLQGQVNGKLATIGSHRLFDAEHPHRQEVCAWVQTAEQNGQTTMLVCDGERVRGYIAVADELRSESPQVVAALRRAGCQTAMLTGDNPQVASAIGARLGIDQVRASLLPQDKLDAIRAMQNEHGAVAMIGDGINDAPALAAATVGIALGGAASAQALESADIVLLGNDLGQLPFTARLAAFTRRLIRENILFSLLTKLAFILLALGGVTSMWLAILADMGVSLAVTFNGMRPLRAHLDGG